MKQSFNRFAIRFLTAVLLGLLLIALHSRVSGGFFSVFVPRFSSPWELSKLVYWPLLGAVLFTGKTKAAVWEPGREVPCLVLAPVTLFLLSWVLSRLNLGSGVFILLWVAVLGGSLLVALLGGSGKKCASVWFVLMAALGAAYVLFTFLPPMWGPFLDPTDVAAMAVIPY